MSQYVKLAAVAFFAVALSAGWAQPGTTTRVSISSAGDQADGQSIFSAVSGNGRFTAFQSDATDLVAGDTNGVTDIFVHDLATGKTERVSVESDGTQANARSMLAAITPDGRYVVFYSEATNLVAGDTNGCADEFVHDRLTGATERVSVSSSGVQGNSACPVVQPSISADGRFVAFVSAASNLVSGDTNGAWDCFVRDRAAGTTEMVSVGDQGQLGNGATSQPSLSADGRYVAFASHARNLITGLSYMLTAAQIFVRDRKEGATELETPALLYPLVVVGNGESGMPHISADGRFVVFQSYAGNLVENDTNGSTLMDIFVRDRLTGTTEIASLGWDGSQTSSYNCEWPSISWDGRYVSWDSQTGSFVADDTNRQFDVFVRDRLLGQTERVSLNSDGGQSIGGAICSSINADGRFVSYDSAGSDVVAGDTNSARDVFVYQRDTPVSNVSGIMLFENLAANATPPSQVELDVRFNGWSMGSWPVDVAADGSYNVAVPMWIVQLSAKPTHWLRRTIGVDATGGDVSGVYFDLPNGDATGDNRVNLKDLSSVLLNFNAFDPMSDLDGSGLVGVADISIVLLNFGLGGDS